MWLLTAEAVRVQHDATVSLSVGAGADGKNRYGSDRLVEYVGQKIVVRFDPDKLHESVFLYQADGRFIGEADCIHAAGFGDSSTGREWKRLNKQRLKSTKAAAQAEASMSIIEASRYLPEPETPEAPQSSAVTRGDFRSGKRVVNSDVEEVGSDERDSQFARGVSYLKAVRARDSIDQLSYEEDL